MKAKDEPGPVGIRIAEAARQLEVDKETLRRFLGRSDGTGIPCHRNGGNQPIFTPGDMVAAKERLPGLIASEARRAKESEDTLSKHWSLAWRAWQYLSSKVSVDPEIIDVPHREVDTRSRSFAAWLSAEQLAQDDPWKRYRQESSLEITARKLLLSRDNAESTASVLMAAWIAEHGAHGRGLVPSVCPTRCIASDFTSEQIAVAHLVDAIGHKMRESVKSESWHHASRSLLPYGRWAVDALSKPTSVTEIVALIYADMLAIKAAGWKVGVAVPVAEIMS